MSAPARESEDPDPFSDGPLNDGPLKYAPKRAPRPEQDQNSNSAPPKFDGEPPWRRKGRPGAFSGDVAFAELRNRLALEPDRMPEPPVPDSPAQIFGAKKRVIGVIALTAVGAAGYLWGSAPPAIAPGPPVTVGAAKDAMPATQEQMVSMPAAPAQAQAALPRLTVNAMRLWQVNEPARLPISAASAGSNVNIVIGGLAPGSTLSAGTPAGPNRWRLSTEDFNNTTVTPPRGFVGVMNLILELRFADNTVIERKGLQLEWSSKSVLASGESSQRHLDAAEIALLVKKGAEFMANGNIGAARLMFQPAAEAGEPMAAFALAETYDPLVLETLAAKGGITPDIALAHSWYEKANALGSSVATERLRRLARLPERTGGR
jgi:hypothetical protein